MKEVERWIQTLVGTRYATGSYVVTYWADVLSLRSLDYVERIPDYSEVDASVLCRPRDRFDQDVK